MTFGVSPKATLKVSFGVTFRVALEKVIFHGSQDLVSQCSATRDTVAATPPCSATRFYDICMANLRCDTPAKGCDRALLRHFKGCSAIQMRHCENIRRKRRHQCSATAVVRHKWCSFWATKSQGEHINPVNLPVVPSRVLQRAAQMGEQFYFIFAVLWTLLYAAKEAFSTFKLAPPWREPPEAPLESRNQSNPHPSKMFVFICLFHPNYNSQPISHSNSLQAMLLLRHKAAICIVVVVVG